MHGEVDERMWFNIRHYPGVRLEELRKTMKNIQDILFSR
jgi:hypothetical protein